MKPLHPSWIAAAALATALALPAAASTHTLPGDDVRVFSPAGAVRIEGTTGTSVIVEVTLAGPDAGELEISTESIDGHPTLRVLYPGSTITYPEMGHGSSTRTTIRSDGTWSGSNKDWMNSRRMTVKGSDGGTKAWADVVVKVPKGKKVSVYNLAGKGAIHGADGHVSFDSGSGSASANNCRGQLSIDVGSGGVSVDKFTGLLSVDTGSGSIKVNDIAGPSATLDTGSGGVSGVGIAVDNLLVDTGSGSVDLALLDTKHGRVDTGSGGVEVELLAPSPDLSIETGSGSVRITVPRNFSARIHVDTGSGGIRSELPMTVDEKDYGTLRGTIGSGAGRLKVDTGSGGVAVLASASASRSKSQ